jgi:hypothetical protein
LQWPQVSNLQVGIPKLEKGGWKSMDYLKSISDVIVAAINLLAKVVDRSKAPRENEEP